MVTPPWRYRPDEEPDEESAAEAVDSSQDEDLTERPPAADAPWVFKELEPIGPDYDDTVLIEYKHSGKRARVGKRVAAEQVSRGRARRL
jgi:hypothetical protein